MNLHNIDLKIVVEACVSIWNNIFLFEYMVRIEMIMQFICSSRKLSFCIVKMSLDFGGLSQLCYLSLCIDFMKVCDTVAQYALLVQFSAKHII